MNKKLTLAAHSLALASGACSLVAVALTQPPFSLSPLVAGACALAAGVMSYISNGIPALGSSSAAPAAPAAPSSPSA